LAGKSLAPLREFAAAGEFSDYWFPDATDPGSVELGVHFRYDKGPAKSDSYQMTFAIDGADGHFTVLWNRIAVTPPQ
jgi:hypothetical protein